MAFSTVLYGLLLLNLLDFGNTDSCIGTVCHSHLSRNTTECCPEVCCPSNYLEICCTTLLSTGSAIGIAIGILFVISFIILICCLCLNSCYLAKKRNRASIIRRNTERQTTDGNRIVTTTYVYPPGREGEPPDSPGMDPSNFDIPPPYPGLGEEIPEQVSLIQQKPPSYRSAQRMVTREDQPTLLKNETEHCSIPENPASEQEQNDRNAQNDDQQCPQVTELPPSDNSSRYDDIHNQQEQLEQQSDGQQIQNMAQDDGQQIQNMAKDDDQQIQSTDQAGGQQMELDQVVLDLSNDNEQQQRLSAN